MMLHILAKLKICMILNATFFLSKQQEKQDLAERVMITRLHLYGKWVKVWNLNLCSISHTPPPPPPKLANYIQLTTKLQKVETPSFLSLWCRNVIMLKYIKRFLIKTWSWCVSVSWRLWYGPRMTQTRRGLADNFQVHIYFSFSSPLCYS